jgi:hypothetical protein
LGTFINGSRFHTHMQLEDFVVRALPKHRDIVFAQRQAWNASNRYELSSVPSLLRDKFNRGEYELVTGKVVGFEHGEVTVYKKIEDPSAEKLRLLMWEDMIPDRHLLTPSQEERLDELRKNYRDWVSYLLESKIKGNFKGSLVAQLFDPAVRVQVEKDNNGRAGHVEEFLYLTQDAVKALGNSFGDRELGVSSRVWIASSGDFRYGIAPLKMDVEVSRPIAAKEYAKEIVIPIPTLA